MKTPTAVFIPEQVSIVFGPNWLISLQEKEGKLLDPIRESLRNEKGRLRKAGADYLAHALLDAIVDSLFRRPGKIRREDRTPGR